MIEYIKQIWGDSRSAINGIYNTAKVFTDVLDDACVEQIQGILDLEVFRDTQVRIMPEICEQIVMEESCEESRAVWSL